MQVIQTEFAQGSQVRPQEQPFRTLARHLQLRLRYARLKVDHGWQKQSINEVENLYFHQHHFRSASTKQAEFRPTPVNAPQTDVQASISKAQDISSSISVFNSRQTPSEILVLRLPQVQKEQERLDNNGSIESKQDDVSVPDAAFRDPQIPQTSSHDGQPSTTPVPAQNRVDFAPGTPQSSKPHETVSGDVSPASGHFVSGATTTAASTAEGQYVEEADDRPSQVHEDGEAHGSSPAQSGLRTATTPSSSTHVYAADAPVSSSSHGAREQASSSQSSQGAQATGSSRTSALTYDSFWSSHSSSVVTYGFGPYAPSAQPNSRPVGQPQTMVVPAKRPAPTDTDTAMLESR
ncbi:hypothetical protein ACEPAF_2673 [Sanghuangporus sanghuang]